MNVQEIKLDDIYVSEEFNCRGHIVAADVIDLAKNIDQQGLIQPVVVSEMGAADGKPWRLLAGFRRFKAHQVLKRNKISANINTTIKTEVDAIALNLSENISRKDLNLEQEARTVGRLVEQFGTRREVIAEKLDMSPGWVQVRLMLFQMGDDAMQSAGAGMIRTSDIRDLFKLFRAAEKDYDPEMAHRKVAEAIHDLKVLKEKKGGKGTIEEALSKRADVKRHRKRKEINEMLDHVLEQMPAGLFSRAMAWCSGEIPTSEFEADLTERCEHYINLADKEY